MSNKNKPVIPHEDDHNNLDLRGTLAMVLALGALMVVSWFGIFMLFMERM
ncbi:cytochrome c oxidase subunit 2A [Salinicoccus sesuvii]|uniref:Cytochrome c oxidase subunit 2A n=1 Tax=Salinicoccus sesuvii TaxID=868281 RepID=A0ABV7N4X8_9STAP